jgi:PAS domain S-box-containing protein
MTPDRENDAVHLRRRAEFRLEADKREALTLPEDPTRLVHELQVHQIELELQNEELARANEEAERLRDKYRDLYDFAPVGYFTLAADGSMLESNLAGASLLGCGRAKLVGHRLSDFMQVESRPAFSEFLDAAWRGSSEESVTLVLQPVGGNPLYVKLQARCSNPDSDAEVSLRLAMMDVTAVKFAHDELQRSFEKFFTYFRP